MQINYAEVIAQVSLAFTEGTPKEQQSAMLFINNLNVLRRIYLLKEPNTDESNT